MRKIILVIAFLLGSTAANASNPIPTTLGDCSISSLTGSASQTLVAANPNRRFLEIYNPNASNAIYVNLAGGTAATGGGTGTVKILAAGSIVFQGFDSTMPINAITVNGTASDVVTCYEGR